MMEFEAILAEVRQDVRVLKAENVALKARCATLEAKLTTVMVRLARLQSELTCPVPYRLYGRKTARGGRLRDHVQRVASPC